MKYLSLKVRTALVMHGYDADNREIIETVSGGEFVEKLVLVERIQSISAQYILVTGSHGRVMYWEYLDDLPALHKQLEDAGLLVG